MTKAERTREKIIAQSAPVFNQQGFFGTSMSDIMHVTGLEKGGIYNHFSGKDALALAAFDYNWKVLSDLFSDALKAAGKSSAQKLLAMIELHRFMHDNPPVIGGCPILNTAVESDDTHPMLRERARAAMDEWQSLIKRILHRGIEREEFYDTIDVDVVTTLIITTLEGATMMANLYNKGVYLERAVDMLVAHIEREVIRPTP